MPRTNQATGQLKKVSIVMLLLKNMLSLMKDDESISELGRFIAAYEDWSKTTMTRGKGPVGGKNGLGNNIVQSGVVRHVNQTSKKPKIAR